MILTICFVSLDSGIRHCVLTAKLEKILNLLCASNYCAGVIANLCPNPQKIWQKTVKKTLKTRKELLVHEIKGANIYRKLNILYW